MPTISAELPDTLAAELKIEQSALAAELCKAAGFGWLKQRRLSPKGAAQVARVSVEELEELGSESFLIESWHHLRPYAQKLIVDFVITSLLWLTLFFFKGLKGVFEVPGWASDFIENIHAAGVVVAFSLFAVMFALDVIKIRSAPP